MAFRMTSPTKATLRLMSRDPDPRRRWTASEICRQADVSPGSIHNLLARLVDLKWLASELEDIDETAEGRRARRLYWFTETGVAEARLAMAESDARMRRPALSGDGLGRLQEQA
jgi:DNA-binding PadR family transcriptional regulator